MKKKIVVISILTLMVLSLVGCYENTENNMKVDLYDELLRQAFNIEPDLNKAVEKVYIDVEGLDYKDRLEKRVDQWIDEGIGIEMDSGLKLDKSEMRLKIIEGSEDKSYKVIKEVYGDKKMNMDVKTKLVEDGNYEYEIEEYNLEGVR